MSEEADAFTMRSCRFLIKHLERGLPKGETSESVAELIQVHRTALHAMKQRTGKGGLVLEMGVLSKKFAGESEPEPVVTKPPVDDYKGDPYEHPLMKEAKEIFSGKWIDRPEVDLFA